MTDEKKPNIDDYRGVVRPPEVIKVDGRDMLDLGLIDSPALVTGVSVAVNKTALEVKGLHILTNWAVQLQKAINKYSEIVKICDCPLCQAKAYIEQSKSNVKVEDLKNGHYL